MNCPNCGHENNPDYRFCEICAAPLAEVELSPVERQACPACKFQNRPGVRFCEQCGQPLALPEPAQPALPRTAESPGTVCPVCQAQNRPGVRFCEQCGQPLASPEPVQPAPPRAAELPGTVCPVCQAQNRPGVRFCEQCGRPLGLPMPFAPQLRAERPRYRRWLIAAAAGFLILLILPVLAALIDYTEHRIRNRPRVSQSQVVKLAGELVAESFSQFEGVTPQVQKVDFGSDTGYRIIYETPLAAEAEGESVTINSVLIFGVNSVTGETSVAVSQ
jgi:predicted amidophosphoribosyltransferase